VVSQVASKIDEVLAGGRPALIGYLPIGFPTLERSIEAVITLINAGVDIIELGIPYSDPVMDGPTIQAAAQIALDNGTKPKDVFHVIEQIKLIHPETPVLAMTYYNPIFRYGVDQFAKDLAGAGGAGLITADLVPEQGKEWIAAADKYHLDKVFLVAPSTPPERLQKVASEARGFIYAASTMGVTGARAEVGNAAETLVADTRKAAAANATGVSTGEGAEQSAATADNSTGRSVADSTCEKHVCVGLGVSTAEQAKQVGKYADGVIVGSAFVKPLLDESKPWDQRLKDLSQIANEIATGVAASRN